MKRCHREGFALILVLISVFATSIVLLLVAKDALTLRFQADRIQVQAIARNLHLSALAWARQHYSPSASNLPSAPESTPLDPNTLSDRAAELLVTAEPINERELFLTIHATSTYGQHRCPKNRTHTLSLIPLDP